ncbi:methyl-accepting chemotaxis protein, partial [Xanthomonas hortorum pv. pelargonii]|nr:methyl-accepting chemotaxis protein [Xanthomonas hortorum pv. pelargonii]
MDEATQQNAALVEEATAAARAMEEQAQQLTEAVAVFKIVEQAPVARPPSSMVAAPVNARFAARPAVGAASIAPPRRSANGTATAASAPNDWQEF